MREWDRIVRPVETSSPSSNTRVCWVRSAKGVQMADRRKGAVTRLVWRWGGVGWQSQRDGAGCGPAAVQTGGKMILDHGRCCVGEARTM